MYIHLCILYNIYTCSMPQANHCMLKTKSKKMVNMSKAPCHLEVEKAILSVSQWVIHHHRSQCRLGFPSKQYCNQRSTQTFGQHYEGPSHWCPWDLVVLAGCITRESWCIQVLANMHTMWMPDQSFRHMATIADKVLLEHIRIQKVPHLTSMGCSGVASTNPQSQPAHNSSWCNKPNLSYIYLYISMCSFLKHTYTPPNVCGFFWSQKT